MTRIVTTHYRYKRPPRKRKPVEIEAPAVVTAKSSRRPSLGGKAAAEVSEPPAIATGGQRAQSSTPREAERVPATPPANDDRHYHQQEAVGQAGDGARQRPRSHGAGEGVPRAHGASGRQ
jgi:hypothetical protein